MFRDHLKKQMLVRRSPFRIETDAALGLFLASIVLGQELLDGLEHKSKLLVVFLLQTVDLAGEVTIAVHQAPELDEGAHDGDVDFDCLFAAKHAGEHRDSLLGERHGRVPETHAIRFGRHNL